MTGGGQEPMRQELVNKINEIQAAERANNSDDDVVLDILNTAANPPRGMTTLALGPMVSSTTQNSGTRGRTTFRASFIAEYDSDGMLQFTYEDSRDDSPRLRTEDQDASVNRVEGIPAAGWKGVEFQGESTNWHHYADLFSDIENNEDIDYLVMGIWVSARKEEERRTDASNYGLLVAVSGNDPFKMYYLAGLAGTAAYEGPATGLRMMKANATAAPEFDIFNAKASLTADFGDATAAGAISGTITEGMTQGGVALPDIMLNSADIEDAINVGVFRDDTSGMTSDGATLAGSWGGRFYGNGASTTEHPGSVAGTFGAKTADDLQAIVGVFGAYKQ